VTATAIDQPLLTPLRVGGLTLPLTILIGLDRPGQVGAANRSPDEAGLNHLADAIPFGEKLTHPLLPAIDEGENTMMVRRSSGVAFIARPVNGGVDRPLVDQIRMEGR
jgi:hypothetical protein